MNLRNQRSRKFYTSFHGKEKYSLAVTDGPLAGNAKKYADVAPMVERLPCKQMAVGSNPSIGLIAAGYLVAIRSKDI